MDEATYQEALRWKHERWKNPTQEDFDTMLAKYTEHGKSPSWNDYHHREQETITKRIMYHLSRGHVILRVKDSDDD